MTAHYLTIVTGPPGTGKTQLVVNAVTNAWLDGEKVLVTSTNNAAVDVAVARAESDVFSGLLIRTGNRTEREQVPGRITAASERAAAHTGDPATSAREVDRNWAEASLCAIRADAAARIHSGADRLAPFARAAAGGGGSFKRTVANSLDNLRGWACTALSASTNFPLESGLFDLVIVDEASQCSLAAVLPLAYRAKRLAVVGDPCQLHPIVPLGDRLWLNRAEAELTAQWLGKVLESISTVGVVTPFAAQAQLITKCAGGRFGRSVLDDADFVCGTAHRLQGDERDAIIVPTACR